MKNLLAKTVYYTKPLENGWAAKMNELVREKIDSGQVSIYQNVSRLGKQTQTQVFDIFFPNQIQTRPKPDPNQTQTRSKPDPNQTQTRPKPDLILIRLFRLGFLVMMFVFIQMEHWYHEI